MFGTKQRELTLEERELANAQCILALCQAARLATECGLQQSTATPIFAKAVALAKRVIL